MRGLIPRSMPDLPKATPTSSATLEAARPTMRSRSLVISHKLLGTKEWFVIHHTNCGMELFSDEVIGDLLEDNLETASFDGENWSNPKHGHGSSHGHFLKWHTFHDNEESVVQDVRRIREHPLVAPHIPIYGYIYNVKTGKLVEVEEATAAGRAVTV